MFAAKDLRNYEFLDGKFTLESAIDEVVRNQSTLLLYDRTGGAAILVTATHVYKLTEITVWDDLKNEN